MLKAHYKPYQLIFTNPVLTSRGQMQVKNGYYLVIEQDGKQGIGECSFIEGLSIDKLDNYVQTLDTLCDAINGDKPVDVTLLLSHPSIRFGYETAILDLENGGNKLLYPSAFTNGQTGIPINGLVWMGSKDFMQQQIEQKLKTGFGCIKIKVGAIDFNEEISLLRFIRSKFPPDVIEIRLDANGAFNATDVFDKLEQLSKFSIHSIEQPVKQKQPMLMQQVCAQSPIPVALDEELIGVPEHEQAPLLRLLKPTYIILKPSLLGGFAICNQWIKNAVDQKTGWWATSALESNIGLNAIAQWVYGINPGMVQGLGTGGLYTNNITSPLYIQNGHLYYNPQLPWAQIL
ncbi:MAG TPA: o-succinylbenzoate synthase [Chitinophagales bacterium]|nr:o-succinylbenzoate synthase [Chitinophagales bacterium]